MTGSNNRDSRTIVNDNDNDSDNRENRMIEWERR